jgi:hypothetical protein
MNRVLIFCLFFLLAPRLHAGENVELRSFNNENVGTVTLYVPQDWKAVERHHIQFGTTFYRLVPPNKGKFDFEILVNDLEHMYMEALVDKDLEIYIESNMVSSVSQSTEGVVKANRFGTQLDGVYARLTDKSPKEGEFLFFTQGVKLLGNKVVLFTLLSNDYDGEVLKKTLSIVDSVSFKEL